MGNIVALDPGYGNTKVCMNGNVSIIQSVVARPRPFGFAAMGMRTISSVSEVTFGEDHFLAGSGAWSWNEPLISQDYTALISPGRQALFYATLADLISEGETILDWLIIGLPVPLLQDQQEAEGVINGYKRYKGKHRFKVGEVEYGLTVNRIKVLPQPVGAYADWLLNEEMQVRKGGTQAEVAVMDLGENTLDLYAIQGGKVSPRFIGGGKVGVRRLLQMMKSNGRDTAELDYELRIGKLKLTTSQLENWLAEVIGSVERIWPNLERFTAVIPTGGGSMILGNALRMALATKGAAIHWPKDPVVANAIGLWKWGCYAGNH